MVALIDRITNQYYLFIIISGSSILGGYNFINQYWFYSYLGNYRIFIIFFISIGVFANSLLSFFITVILAHLSASLIKKNNFKILFLIKKTSIAFIITMVFISLATFIIFYLEFKYKEPYLMTFKELELKVLNIIDNSFIWILMFFLLINLIKYYKINFIISILCLVLPYIITRILASLIGVIL